MKQSYASLEDALAASDDPRWERPFRCPVHADRHASASVNVQKGLWVCYACQGRGSTQGLEFDLSFDPKYIEELMAEPRTHPDTLMATYTAWQHPYWTSRFSSEAIAHFELGYDPDSDRPCYPLRDMYGRLLGVVTRNLTDEGPKYKYPSGIKSHQMLWNYTPEPRDWVILCEGAMDVVAVWEAGFDALGIFGSHLSRRQLELVRGLRPMKVILAFDNDHAGKNCTKAAQELIGREYEISVFDWERYGEYGDVGEIPTEILCHAIEQLVAQ